MALSDVAISNQHELRKLVLSIRANPHQLNLLLAICDDRNLQAELIEGYERELNKEGFHAFQTRLNLKQPSLRATLAELVAYEPALQAGEPAVVTVLDASYLLEVRLSEEKSEQERFFFSLQWQREALRQFEFPVVLWLSNTVATRLGQQAPDFWSWRRGVFEFVSGARVPDEVGQQPMSGWAEAEKEHAGQLSIEDLQRQIEELQEASPESSLLITLYNNLGEAYQRDYEYAQALAAYEAALELAKAKNNLAGQARSFRNLGNSLRYSGRSYQAIDYYEQSVEIARKIRDRYGEADSLSNLGDAYYEMGQYQQDTDYQQQALKLFRVLKNKKSEAQILNKMGSTYNALGEYQLALNSLQKALEIAHQIGDRKGEGNALGNLGNAYSALAQPEKDINFQQQWLTVAREIGDRRGEAKALMNLGSTYMSLGQYQQAIDFEQQSLEIAREIGDRQSESSSLGNLGNAYYSLGQYQQAIDFQRQSLEIKREIGDRNGEAISQLNTGISLAKLNENTDARDAFEAARALFESLELPHMVEECDQQISALDQQD